MVTKKSDPFLLGLKEALAAISKSTKILILSHINPDGDTLGCMLGLGLALMQKGKHVFLACQDAVPTRFQFLPGSELIQSHCQEKVDTAIAVDCGGVKQLGSLRDAFLKARHT